MKKSQKLIFLAFILVPVFSALGFTVVFPSVAEARSRGKGNIYFGGGFLREINSYKLK